VAPGGKGDGGSFQHRQCGDDCGLLPSRQQTPKYGEGWLAYGKRFGAALADGATRNFFSAGNLMSEFWPDVQQKFFRKKEK
jgi:hypothetical protein